MYIIKGYKKWKENESKIKLYSPFIRNSVDQPLVNTHRYF